MQFLSDNAALVHPRLWEAMRAADEVTLPYDGDDLSLGLDARFAELFGRDCAVLWAATGTAANCLALSALCPPHGGVLCHREAHIETDEGGAPGFYLHGAKLMLVEGEGAKVSAEALSAHAANVRPDVHQVQPHVVSITQASEYGRVYRASEIAAIRALCDQRGWALHMDGARFANAAAFLGEDAAMTAEAAARQAAGMVDALTFGCVKNGGMGAEAIVLFDTGLADLVRVRRKRAGHLQSKGRYLAAQIHAMLDDDLWLANAAKANAVAAQIARGAPDRLLHPVEANEVFLTCTANERDRLRAQGFGFYDWGAQAARFVTAWTAKPEDGERLANAIAVL